MNSPSTLQRCGRCKQVKPYAEFQPSYRGRNGTMCRACASAYNRGESTVVAHDPRECINCGAAFVPVQSAARRVYCTLQCQYEDNNKRRRERRLLTKSVRKCLHCGGDMPKSMRADARFCSEQCNSAAHQWTRYAAKRIAVERPASLTFRALVAHRSRWHCGICGGPVDRTVTFPDPEYGSLDHIVALASGGTNDVENLQLAHLRCNLKKGAR